MRLKKTLQLITLLTLGLFMSCDKETSNDTKSDQPNILLIIADDMGKDATNGFSEGTIKPNTPNINSIKDQGITFSNFWSNPTCSPTRATILTGKYGYRTGVKIANDVLDESETSLFQFIEANAEDDYATAIVGKWHLSGNHPGINPESFGMDYYAGLPSGAAQDYYQWGLSEDGVSTNQTEYITEVFTELAIDWVNDQEKPWFLWLAYTAPHTPFHVPPDGTHEQGDLPDYIQGMDPMPYYMAAIESMDFQIGRLLDSIPESERSNTVIIFIGDNGTPGQVAQSPYSAQTVKGSLYQGGINTPLFVSGLNVTRTGARDESLVTSTDLFATVADLAGAPVTQVNDSRSIKSLFTSSVNHSDFQYSDSRRGNNDEWAISDGRYKLITKENGNQEMFDLQEDPYEEENLLNEVLDNVQQEARSKLEDELLLIRN